MTGFSELLSIVARLREIRILHSSMPVRLSVVTVCPAVDLPTGRVRSGVVEAVCGETTGMGIVRRRGAS